MSTDRGGLRGKMAELYDIFVDWKGRLGREMPGLVESLRRAGARRVLDAGCGTGRHVAALNEAGFEAVGADASEEMLQQAREFTGAPERFFEWRMGEPPPADLAARAPFDAIVCLGNALPQILLDADVRATLGAWHGMLKPGGVALAGLKAVAVRRETKSPYLPLLKRSREGKPIFFIRFVDFDAPPGDDGADVCDFHKVIAGDGEEAVHHRQGRMRVWDPKGLEAAFRAAGFDDVSVSASLGDPTARVKGEDVFVHARR